MILSPGDLDRLLTIERPVADESFTGAGRGSWAKVADAWAQVQDELPSRSESQDGGFAVSARRARVRMYHREDISPEMRLVMGARVMQIISGPVELGFRDGIELRVEDYSAGGNAA